MGMEKHTLILATSEASMGAVHKWLLPLASIMGE